MWVSCSLNGRVSYYFVFVFFVYIHAVFFCFFLMTGLLNTQIVG